MLEIVHFQVLLNMEREGGDGGKSMLLQGQHFKPS